MAGGRNELMTSTARMRIHELMTRYVSHRSRSSENGGTYVFENGGLQHRHRNLF